VVEKRNPGKSDLATSPDETSVSEEQSRGKKRGLRPGREEQRSRFLWRSELLWRKDGEARLVKDYLGNNPVETGTR